MMRGTDPIVHSCVLTVANHIGISYREEVFLRPRFLDGAHGPSIVNIHLDMVDKVRGLGIAITMDLMVGVLGLGLILPYKD